MQEQNDKLGALLKRWPEIEPRPAFDQDVLRRIRLERAAVVESAGLDSAFLDRLVSRLTSAWGIAVAAAIVVGFLLANTTPAPDAGRDPLAAGLPDALRPGTLSGNYVALMGGNLR